MKNILIPIPIDSYGKFDIEAQREIADIFALYQETQEDIKFSLQELINK